MNYENYSPAQYPVRGQPGSRPPQEGALHSGMAYSRSPNAVVNALGHPNAIVNALCQHGKKCTAEWDCTALSEAETIYEDGAEKPSRLACHRLQRKGKRKLLLFLWRSSSLAFTSDIISWLLVPTPQPSHLDAHRPCTELLALNRSLWSPVHRLTLCTSDTVCGHCKPTSSVLRYLYIKSVSLLRTD